jgi:hypothetical protein
MYIPMDIMIYYSAPFSLVNTCVNYSLFNETLKTQMVTKYDGYS